MAGHGAQKLFGWFGGYGVDGTGGFMESLGLRPGRRWAILAGTGEFGGGILTALGMFGPVGPLGIVGSMLMAIFKVHWNKPIWVTAGGSEFPLTNAVAATTIMLAEPTEYSVDRLLGIRIPRWFALVGLAGVLGVVGYGTRTGVAQPEQSQEEEAGGELIGGEATEHPA